MKLTEDVSKEEILLAEIRRLVNDCNNDLDTGATSITKNILLLQKLSEYNRLSKKNGLP